MTCTQSLLELKTRPKLRPVSWSLSDSQSRRPVWIQVWSFNWDLFFKQMKPITKCKTSMIYTLTRFGDFSPIGLLWGANCDFFVKIKKPKKYQYFGRGNKLDSSRQKFSLLWSIGWSLLLFSLSTLDRWRASALDLGDNLISFCSGDNVGKHFSSSMTKRPNKTELWSLLRLSSLV